MSAKKDTSGMDYIEDEEDVEIKYWIAGQVYVPNALLILSV